MRTPDQISRDSIASEGGHTNPTTVNKLQNVMTREFNYLISQPWLKDWLSKPLVIEKPDVPVMHQCMKTLNLKSVMVDLAGNEVSINSNHIAAHELPSIMIEHDWAAVVQAESGGEWRPPFDRQQVFEFKISGLRIVCLVHDFDNEDAWTMAICIRSPNKEWFYNHEISNLLPDKWSPFTITIGKSPFPPLYNLLHKQIRAACIMLDSEVAIHEPIRAPHKPNDPKRDRLPLPPMSYHILRLNKRYRVAPMPPAIGTDPYDKRTSPRLHFRRGHWRHYTSHKVWIRWSLVGNPDLGVITKTYTL